MSRFRSDISLSGPFFEHDPADTFLGNLSTMLHRGAEEGVRDVVGRMGTGRAEISATGGHVADRVIGIVPETTQMVVMVATAGLDATEAISVKAAASEVEGQSHAFRRTAARMRAARLVNVSELLKGIQ